MKGIDFLCCKDDEEELQQYLIEETTLYKTYAINIDGAVVRRHVAKIDQSTGLPRYLAENRIKFSGTSPVKDSYWKIEEVKDGK